MLKLHFYDFFDLLWTVRVENVRLYPSPRATLTRYIANGLAQAYAAANAVVASMLTDNASQFGLSCWWSWLSWILYRRHIWSECSSWLIPHRLEVASWGWGPQNSHKTFCEFLYNMSCMLYNARQIHKNRSSREEFWGYGLEGGSGVHSFFDDWYMLRNTWGNNFMRVCKISGGGIFKNSKWLPPRPKFYVKST